MEAALELFIERGYEATSVADISAAAGMTKAAFSYHFPAKEDLLLALIEPFLIDLETVVGRRTETSPWPTGVRSLLVDHPAVLLHHRDLVSSIDGDKAVLRHATLGGPLAANNAALRRAISGGADSPTGLIVASATLGTFVAAHPQSGLPRPRGRPRRHRRRGDDVAEQLRALDLRRRLQPLSGAASAPTWLGYSNIQSV